MSTSQFTNMTANEAVRFMANAAVQPVRKRLQEIVGAWNVVDLGCGKGEEVSEHWHHKQYLGVDCSVELIRIAQYRHPHYLFQVSSVQDLAGHWTFGVMKAVLEHLPYLEALAVYDCARALTDTLLVVWHMEPSKMDPYEARYQGELAEPMWQNQHPLFPFQGMVEREECGKHVIWTVV